MPAPKDPERYKEFCQKISMSNKGRRDSLETRERKRKATIGSKNPFFGKRHTEEAKQQNREKHLGTMLGSDNHFFGKTHKPESIKQISESRSGKCCGADNPSWKGGKITRICKVCGEVFNTTRYHINKGYGFLCSATCRGIYVSKTYSGKNHPNYVDGGQDPYCELWTRDLRERVRAWFGYCCFECGTHVSLDKLCVHHVWWNKKTCCDDSQRTLIPLCPSCHGRLKKKFKFEKSQYFQDLIDLYYEGKCWLTKEEFHTYYGMVAATWQRKRILGLVSV